MTTDALLAQLRLEEKAAVTATNVMIELNQRAFSYWSVPLDRCVVEGGEFVVEVGNHSRDLPLTPSITVEAPSVGAPPLTIWSTYHEWLADDGGRALLDEAAEAGQPDLRTYGDLVHVIGNFPLMSLASFVGMSPDYDTVLHMADAWASKHGGTR